VTRLLLLIALVLKLDDAPWKNRTPEEEEADRKWRIRDSFHFQLFRGGARHLEECPNCFALVTEERLPDHISAAHP